METGRRRQQVQARACSAGLPRCRGTAGRTVAAIRRHRQLFAASVRLGGRHGVGNFPWPFTCSPVRGRMAKLRVTRSGHGGTIVNAGATVLGPAGALARTVVDIFHPRACFVCSPVSRVRDRGVKAQGTRRDQLGGPVGRRSRRGCKFCAPVDTRGQTLGGAGRARRFRKFCRTVTTPRPPWHRGCGCSPRTSESPGRTVPSIRRDRHYMPHRLRSR